MKSVKFITILAMIAGLALAGCVDQQTVQEIKNGIKEIKESQSGIKDDLAKLQNGQKDLKAEVAKIKVAPAAAGKRPPAPTGPVEVPTANAFFKGDPKAKVSIVEWSDFQCPFCKKILPIVEDTLKDPEVKGKVNFVFKQFPLSFHKDAEPAGRASVAAGKQGKFYEMHDKIFENQRALNEENYIKWAGEIGLDVEKFKKDYADPAVAKQVKQEMAEGQKAGVRGTPTVFIGCNKGDKFVLKKASGRSVDFYKQMIKESLKDC